MCAQYDPLTWKGQGVPNSWWKIQISICSCHSEAEEKCFWHISHWQHFKINLYCPKQCHVIRSQSGLGRWPAAQASKDGYILPLWTWKHCVVSNVAHYPSTAIGMHSCSHGAQKIYIKSKYFSPMTSKIYLLTESCSFPPRKWGFKSTLQCMPMAAVPS